ncbi:helix-turn-helix domain-containing protein [Nakamurella aerolata]|uniref:Helix-turn-helix domain-containing protein n=1 Tax=Nakamurella aerolata TaxID=1656892 RepID=A0A849A5R1_9ACTN|nr:helix-turn-helix domain-containing protein [Nakamurella aerolata]NNG36324.1 helix-turn-helix domain-containing protein [Nakamurella aerolata]
MSAVLDVTVLPPPAAEGADSLALIADSDVAGQTLNLPGGVRVAVPAELAEVIRAASAALLAGRAVKVEQQSTVLTTQQAADLLDISRPTLVRLLETGQIPFQQPGRHRRIALSDLVAYQNKIRRTRRAALDAMSEQAGADNLYVHNEFHRTR